jgi:glycosyltransferase involved in cell wall biosynthesis
VYVSVIIPVFNASKYIARAIDSVLIQPEVKELILVDDGSKDDSLKICEEFKNKDDRIIILQHAHNKNRGVSATRNEGIKAASNEYVAFLDADDYYLPDRFKIAKEIFINDKTVDAVYELVGVYDEENELKPYSIIEPVSPDILFENLQPLGEKVWFSINGLIVKKIFFSITGFFDETLKTSEDTLHWFKMAAMGKLINGNIKLPVTIVERGNINSITTNQQIVDNDFVKMLFKLFKFCKANRVVKNRKELVLDKFLFHSFKSNNSIFKKYGIALNILFTDFSFVISSPIYRRFIGNISGYNFFKKL